MAIRVPLEAHEADDGASAGAQVAFEDLWQHRAALRDLCQRIVGDAATADDVVQETYIRALRNLDSLEQRPSLMPWLATVARRRSIDELRRRRYQHPVEVMPDEGTKPEFDPGETVGVSETVQRVREALTALTERERDLLMRQVNQGLTLAQLAEAEESSIASVRSVLSRARSKLRGALSDAGARVLAPVGVAGGWLRRKLGALNARVQQVSPVIPGGYERLGEMATVTAAAAALTIGGVLVPSAIDSSGPSGVTVRAERASDSDGVVTPAVAGSEQAPAGARGGTGAATEAGSPSSGGGSAAPTGESGGTGTLPTGTLPDGTPAAPNSPTPPPDHGPPLAPHAPPPASPDDAEISDLGASSPSSSNSSGSVFALGHYGGACADSCDALFRSDDGGRSWSALAATDLAARSILVPPGYNGGSEPRVFAVGSQGLQRSTNGGHSFSTVPGGEGLSGPATISPAFNQGHDKIYVGVAPFWSYDASENSLSVLGLSGITGATANFAFAPDFVTSGVIYAGSTTVTPDGTKAAVYRCAGGSCSPVVLDGLEGTPKVVAYDTPGGDRVVVAFRNGASFISVGDTLDFEALDVPVAGPVADAEVVGTALYVAFRSHGAERNGGLAVTGDAGASWDVLSGSSVALRKGTQSVAIVGGRILASLGASQQGVLCSDSGGAAWSRRCS